MKEASPRASGRLYDVNNRDDAWDRGRWKMLGITGFEALSHLWAIDGGDEIIC